MEWMANRLKVDLHVHTREDPKDHVFYSSFELIDRASELGFDALSITNHNAITYSNKLVSFAEKRGIVLIPGIEVTLSNTHVLIINPQPDKNFFGFSLADLPRLRDERSLIIAPHPFFPGFKSLKNALFTHLPNFDAIEFSCFYNHFLNWNKKGILVAAEAGLPLIGNSDSHNLWQLGTTYTLVEAEKDIISIIQAIKKGKIEIQTISLSPLAMFRIAMNFVLTDRLNLPLRI